MATPQVPPRPARSAAAPASTTLESPQVPLVPPRPTSRRHERSVSPGRDRYAQSPLNAPFLPKPGNDNYPFGNVDKNTSGSNLDLPQRPPSVTLPSIGQEGNEYESYSEYETEPLSRTVSAMSATQTSHVSTDLPLHAPKPGLSQSEATARVQTVTRSDNPAPSSPGNRRWSAQLDDKDPQSRPLRSRGSLQLRSSSAAEHERPGSATAEDHGIPQIGTQVPMYRFAGDVQAPSPAPQHTTGQESTSRSRHHHRKGSARDQSNPPDSYGRHGHGIFATDKFEKDWYAKHPEALAQEGHYSHTLHGNRADYVLSSEELNKLVRESGKDAGFGTAPNVVGLPDEQIGYIASEEYASRMSSRPGSAYSNIPSPLANQAKFDSLLRKVQLHEKGASTAENELTRQTTGDSEVIHIDAPEQHWSKVTGEGADTPPVDLGLHGGNTVEQGGFIDEQGYGIPILASDEIRPETAWQRPAILPNPHDRAASSDLHNHFGSRPGSTGHSRPGSRPGSIHGMSGLSRYVSHEEHDVHTPLDDVEEYEPLFSDDKENPKPVTATTRFRHRPDMKHRFPSQDIWEDSPDSARLETEVDTPEPEEQELATGNTSSTFESPQVEAARKGEPTEADRARLLSKEEQLAQSDFKPQIRHDLRRPGPHRFPSSDIWEDSPDSARLETTVGEAEDEETSKNPAAVAGAVVNTTTDRGDLSGTTSRQGATSGEPIVPQRPVRPLKHKASQPKEHSHLSEVYTASSDDQQPTSAEIQRSSIETKKPPSIPARPKPQIPVRPNRSDAVSPPDTVPSPKAKPPIPAKPMGSKIAALQAGFMSDLNNRLKLGPHAPPKPVEPEKNETVEEEKAPLEDARKSRARGPARRKPGTSPSAPTPSEGKKMPKLSFAKPVTVWHISPKGTLDVVYEAPEPASEEPLKQTSTIVTEKAVDASSDSDHIVIPTKSSETPSIIAPVTSRPDLGLGAEEMSGAFPEPTAPGTKSIGIDPLPAVSGPGNPISIPAGEPLPPRTQSITDTVTLDKESYENAGAGTVPPSVSTLHNVEPETLHSVTTLTQTGEKSIEISPNTPGAQKLIVIEGGNAQTGEDVVVQAEAPKDEVGHVREDLV